MQGWQRLGELSTMLQKFRRMYVHRELDEDSPIIWRWRQELREFLKRLLRSCEVQGAREDGEWVHFRFEGPLSKVLGHSCCDWCSPDAFRCGLMSEVVQALLQVQSELPVCTSAVVHVLLHRMAVVRPGKETKGPFMALLSGLQDALDFCPAMPSATLEASIEDCLRRPSAAAAAWSLGATRTFVGGVLSLASRSPRSLCQAVVSVLVRFVADEGCGFPDDSLAVGEEERDPRPPSWSCASCAATTASVGPPESAAAAAGANGRSGPLRCAAQEKRDLVLEGVLRWAVDVHFRRCSLLLQDSLHRSVCSGVRQALDAADPPPPPGGRFPLGCRLLLSFVGGLAADGGSQVASLLQERCGAELQPFLARARVELLARGMGCSGARNAAGATAPPRRRRRLRLRRRPELPALDAYVGHLCLSRHVSEALAASHLGWLAQQALAVLRLQDEPEDASGTEGGLDGPGSEEITAVLVSLSHAVALLLTRPGRGRGGGGGGSGSAVALTETAGKTLEIVFDSEARPLSGVLAPLAEAAIDVLKEAGRLQLAQPEELLRPPRAQTPMRVGSHGHGAPDMTEKAPPCPVSGDGASFGFGKEIHRASVAFRNSWPLVAGGLDTCIPSLVRARKRALASDEGSGGESGDGSGGEDFDEEPSVGSGWDCMPDEVTLRVFSFLTPKRICRLACVDRAWRELLMVPRVWMPLFEARWPVAVIESEEELAGLSGKLLLEGSCPKGEGRRKKKKKRREKTGVVRWRLPEETAQPTLDWMALYRDRHRAERAARGRVSARTNFSWLVCPFMGCVCALKSEFAAKRHVQTHKRPRVKRREKRSENPTEKSGYKTHKTNTRRI